MGLSVLMSVYIKENPQYFKEALESIFAQTMAPDEIIIMKDGPVTDELESVIEYAKKTFKGVKVYGFEKNVKLGRALAKGLEYCSNEIVARMDTDDICVKDRFEKQYNYLMNHPETDICGGFIEEFQDSNRNIKQLKKMPVTHEEIYKYGKLRNPMNHMTVMFRKSKVLEAGGYRHFPFLEDYDLWIRMLSSGKRFANIENILVNVRTGENVYARRGGREYCKTYLSLRKNQYKLKYINISEYILACAITLAITLMPVCVRKQVYQKILRK